MIVDTYWAMEPTALRALLDTLAHAASVEAAEARAGRPLAAAPAPPLDVDPATGTATIKIHGPVLKNAPAVLGWLGIATADVTQIGAQLREAIGRDDVRAVALDIHSPGGSVSGVADLASEIRAASELKPVHAHAADLAASAAYWLGAQARTFTAGRTAALGSIGVYATLPDTSRAAEAQGVKVHLISSAPLKGAGVDGVPVTDAQVIDAKRTVDALAAHFAADVAQGRRLSPEALARVATGQIWIGKDAVDLGLADMVSAGPVIPSNAGIAPQGRVADMADQNQAAGDLAQAQKEALEAAHAQIAALKAQAEEARAAAAAVKAQAQRDRAGMILEANASRITPAMRSHVEKIGALYGEDLDGFAAFVGSLPVATHAAPIGSAPAEPSAEAASAAAPQPTDADRALAARYGVDPNKLAAARSREETR